MIFDLSICRVFCIVWYLEKIYDLFPWTHAKLNLCPYVELSALFQTTLLFTCHGICEIFYTNKIPKFCITDGWYCHKKCVFQLLSSPHVTILILWWPHWFKRIFFIQKNINNHCILHAVHPCLGRPSPGNVRNFAREIHFDQK